MIATLKTKPTKREKTRHPHLLWACLLIIGIPIVSYAQISPNSATKAVATNPPSPKMIEVDVPDVGIMEFPSSMSLDEIEAVLNKRFPPRQNTTAASFSELKTLDGGVYRSVRVLKKETDGILVNYIPDGGGMGAAKLKFKNLPESLQKEFGYDADRASAYEAEQARGLAQLRLQMLAEEKAALARRRANELVEAKADLALAEAKLKALRSAVSISLFEQRWREEVI